MSSVRTVTYVYYIFLNRSCLPLHKLHQYHTLATFRSIVASYLLAVLAQRSSGIETLPDYNFDDVRAVENYLLFERIVCIYTIDSNRKLQVRGNLYRALALVATYSYLINVVRYKIIF